MSLTLIIFFTNVADVDIDHFSRNETSYHSGDGILGFYTTVHWRGSVSLSNQKWTPVQ